MSVRRYYLARNRDHERVMSEITERDKPFLKIPGDEWVRAEDYDALIGQRDEALQALKMLCEHHYTYAGADADTANDHGLYAKVKTARQALISLTAGDPT